MQIKHRFLNLNLFMSMFFSRYLCQSSYWGFSTNIAQNTNIKDNIQPSFIVEYGQVTTNLNSLLNKAASIALQMFQNDLWDTKNVSLPSKSIQYIGFIVLNR